MAGLDSNRGAKRAREARAALGLDPAAPLPCLLDVVERAVGLPVVVARLLDGLAGACVPFGARRLLFVNGTEPRVRQRFTLAHELGHAWIGHDGGVVIDTAETLNGGTTTPLEIQANAFAAEFLIPKVALAGTAPGLDGVVALAARHGTSALAALFRLQQCRAIDPERAARIRAEIDAGEHYDAFDRLGLAPPTDRLEAIASAGLPYLSPELEATRLGAAVRGDAAADPRLAAALARLL